MSEQRRFLICVLRSKKWYEILKVKYLLFNDDDDGDYDNDNNNNTNCNFIHSNSHVQSLRRSSIK